jgi:hypothetical protein
MPIRWPDLSAYGIRLEAWEGRQTQSNAKIFYLVAFGDIDIYSAEFKRLGGKRVELFPNPKLDGFYFPMPIGEGGARLLAGIQSSFPNMQTALVERREVMRSIEGRTAQMIAAAIEQAKALKPRVDQIDPLDPMAGGAAAEPDIEAPKDVAVPEPAVDLAEDAAADRGAEGVVPAIEAKVKVAAEAPVEGAADVAEIAEVPIVAEIEAVARVPVFAPYRGPAQLSNDVRVLFAAMTGYQNAPRFLAPADQERGIYARAAAGEFAGFPQLRHAQMVAICPPAVQMPNEQEHDGVRVARSDYWFALKAMDVMAPGGKALLVLGASEREVVGSAYSGHTSAFLRYIRAHYNVVDHFEIPPPVSGSGLDGYHQVLVIDGVRQADEVVEAIPPAALVETSEDLVNRAIHIARRWNYAEAIEGRFAGQERRDTAVPDHAGVQDVTAAGPRLPGDVQGGEAVRSEPDTGVLAGAVPQRDGVADHGGAAKWAGGRGADQHHRGALADAEGLGRGDRGDYRAQGGDLRRDRGDGRDGDRPAVAVPGRAGLLAGQDGGRPRANGADPARDIGQVLRNENQDRRLSVVQPNRAPGNDAREHGGEGSERRGAEAGRGELRELNAARRAALAPVNALQSQYTPLSSIRAQGTMIPMNLSVPTEQAMRSLQNRRGEINRFVAEQLQMGVADLPRFFYAEQVDAIAQQLDNRIRGEGAILGDMTGVGKGRVLAALIRHSVQNGRVPIFITEKANLFADIIRDLEGVESTHLLNPLIINDGVAIENEMGEVVLRSSDREDIDRVVNSGQMGDFNAVFMTYSQIHREDSPRSRFLAHIATGNDLIIDESHNAGGDSVLGANTQTAVDRAASVTYSSATWAKRPENMAIYSRTRLGVIARSPNFHQIMQKGGEPLQEIISSMLAQAGQYIRREHDYRRAEFATHIATDSREEHRSIANRVAETWAHIAALNGTVFSYIEERNRELIQFREQLERDRDEGRIERRAYDLGRRMGLSGVGIGSKIGQMVDHLMLVLSADVTAELAIEAIRRGEKPVIALFSTLGEAIKEFKLRDQAAAAVPQDQNAAAVIGREVVCRADYRDLLQRTLDSLLQVTVRDANGNVRHMHYLERLREDADPASARLADMAERLIGRIREMISELPALPLSPIDWMRHKIEQAGYRVGELTGRSLMVDYSTENRPVYRALPPSNSRNRNRIINAFNDGSALGDAGLDAVIVNRSAAAGISLHSDATFRDQRKRHMMIVQPDPDVNAYMQLLGRIFRANMVGTPIYTNVLLDLPTTTRPAAILNRKLAQLSANTTSNRESSNRLDAPDMFNWLGDKVALELLENDTDMARMLLIDVNDERRRMAATRDTRLMYRLTARLPMLPTSQQEEVYTRLEEVFKLQLQHLEQAGETPFKTREFDIKARVVHEEVLEEGIDPSNPFDAPLYLRVIEFQEKLPNLSHEDAIEALERAQLKTRSGHVGTRFPFQDLAPQMRTAIATREQTEIDVSRAFENVQAALADPAPNIFKRYDMQRRFLATIEDKLQYGVLCHVPVSTSMTEYRTVEAWFLGVTPPKFEQRFDCFSEFQLKFLSLDPDFYGTVYASLSSVMGAWATKEHTLIPEGQHTSLQSARFRFANRPTGAVTARRAVLCGNLLRAVEVAREKKAGTTAVFTNESGERMRGVIMPAGFQMQELTGGRMPLANTDMAIAALRQHRDAIEARWHAAKFLIAPGAGNRGLRIEITGDDTFVTRPEIAGLGFVWQETQRSIKGTRRRLAVRHVQDVTFEQATRFMQSIDREVGIRWSCDATTTRRNWAQQWLIQHRDLPMAAGMEP